MSAAKAGDRFPEFKHADFDKSLRLLDLHCANSDPKSGVWLAWCSVRSVLFGKPPATDKLHETPKVGSRGSEP